MSSKGISYKDSGVDIKAGEHLVESIKEIVRETHNTSVLSNIGGFGGLFMPDLRGFEQPVFVSSVDGVGTKLIVAFKMGKYDTIGECLVNHCVNDIAVCGATPLFFLDYFSTGRLEQNVAFDVIRGFTKACKENKCALVGGETAEMPDIYKDGEFDLAGTIVGIVDKKNVIDGSKVKKGDKLIGFSSTGLHTNGYSLARKALFSKFDVSDRPSQLNGESVGEALLKVHRSYLGVISGIKEIDGVNAFAHITGGGIEGNTKRVIPKGTKLDIQWKSWERPAIFNLIQEAGNVAEEDMYDAFNLGIGLVALVNESAVDKVMAWATSHNEKAWLIGSVI